MTFFDDTGDGEAGKRARDEGMARVLKDPYWTRHVLYGIRRIPFGTKFIGEDIRITFTKHGFVKKPHHHNAWGAVINRGLRLDLFIKTGEQRSMKDERSHSRLTPVYVRTRKR